MNENDLDLRLKFSLKGQQNPTNLVRILMAKYQNYMNQGCQKVFKEADDIRIAKIPLPNGSLLTLHHDDTYRRGDYLDLSPTEPSFQECLLTPDKLWQYIVYEEKGTVKVHLRRSDDSMPEVAHEGIDWNTRLADQEETALHQFLSQPKFTGNPDNTMPGIMNVLSPLLRSRIAQ